MTAGLANLTMLIFEIQNLDYYDEEREVEDMS